MEHNTELLLDYGDDLKHLTSVWVYFDGGTSGGNPGQKYGSFEIYIPDTPTKKFTRLQFGKGTNNEAEFEALIAGLQWCKQNMHPESLHLLILTDSMIVRNRVVQHDFRVGNHQMGQLCRRTHDLLHYFGSWEIKWHDRMNNVERFGH